MIFKKTNKKIKKREELPSDSLGDGPPTGPGTGYPAAVKHNTKIDFSIYHFKAFDALILVSTYIECQSPFTNLKRKKGWFVWTEVGHIKSTGMSVFLTTRCLQKM